MSFNYSKYWKGYNGNILNSTSGFTHIPSYSFGLTKKMKTLKWLLIITISSLLFGILFLPALAGQIVYRLTALVRGQNRPTLWYLFEQIAVAVDVAAGSVIYGSRHTISAKTGQLSYLGSRWHKIQEKLIDTMFYRGHCKDAAIKENLIKENS